MITDTVNVWAEVLDSKLASHRARHAHSTRPSSKPKRGFALPYHDADEEADWRRGVVKTLGEVQGNAMDGIVDVEIRGSELADMSVCISDTIRDFHWHWDVMSVRNMAPSILSTQLFMPLVTIATVTSSLGTSIDDASDEALRTAAERKASTAKAMPVHHMRGFFSRPSVQTLLKSIAQVDGSPTPSLLTTNNTRNPSLMSVDMAEAPVDTTHKIPESTSRALARTSSSSPGLYGGPGSSRKGKGRDSSTEDEDEGIARKIPRGATPRRSNIRSTDLDSVITPFSKGRPADPDSTATEAETTRDWSKNITNTTLNEDETADPLPQSSKRPASPKPNRPSPRLAEKPRLARAQAPVRTPARASITDTTDVFGTQNQTQASSDDSDREAELKRRIRAAGAIGSAAVRTPAGGGLGSRMVRKKF